MYKKILKKYLLCSRYNKDIWGKVLTTHKSSNFRKSKIKASILKIFGKNKRLLEGISKNSILKNSDSLNYSFEISKWNNNKKKKQLKTWMRLFFLTKLLWSYYGNLSKKQFLWFCHLCLSKKTNAFFLFIKIFELRLPMFIYWAGLSSSLEQANQWVRHGFVKINNKTFTNLWKPIKIYDLITFHIKLWPIITNNYVRVLFYAFKSISTKKCKPQKITNEIFQLHRAHFISTPNYLYFDYWSMSIYWWKEPSINDFKYYFSINLSNIIKYVTI